MNDAIDQDPPESEPQLPALTIDFDLYESYLIESDLSDEEKIELMQTLWSIVMSFVDLGFGIHPMQQACEQGDENRIFLPHDMLSSLTATTPAQTTDNALDQDDDHGARQEES